MRTIQYWNSLKKTPAIPYLLLQTKIPYRQAVGRLYLLHLIWFDPLKGDATNSAGWFQRSLPLETKWWLVPSQAYTRIHGSCACFQLVLPKEFVLSY